MRQHDKNQQVQQPLEEASAQVIDLEKKKEKHDAVKAELEKKQKEIAEISA